MLRRGATWFVTSGFGAALILLAAVLWVERSVPLPQIGRALEGHLSDVRAKQIDVVIDISKLFISWTIAIAGGAIFFLKGIIEKKLTLSKLDAILLQLAIACAVISLLYGHLVLTNTVSMLEVDRFAPSDPLIAGYLGTQYRYLLATVVLMVIAANRFFWSNRTV